MWGRAGRRGRGLAVYIAGEDALDQFFCRHPDEFLDRPVEAAILDPHSPEIYAEHLLCAAHEAPLTDADAPILGDAVARARRGARATPGFLRERATGFVPQRADDYPAARVALRSASRRQLRPDRRRARARCSGRSRPARAYATVHEGAVYLHIGRSYDVLELDLAARRALLEPFDGDYFTQAKRESMTYIERLHEQRETLRRDALASARSSTRRRCSATSARACRTTR